MTFNYIRLAALTLALSLASIFTATPAIAQDICQDFDRKVRQIDVEALYKAMPDRVTNGYDSPVYRAYMGYSGVKGMEETGGRYPIFKDRPGAQCLFTDYNMDAVWIYFAHSPEQLSPAAPACQLSDKKELKRVKKLWKSKFKKHKILSLSRKEMMQYHENLMRLPETRKIQEDPFDDLEDICPMSDFTGATAESFECYVDYAKSEVLPYYAIFLKNAYLNENMAGAIDSYDMATGYRDESYQLKNYVRSVHHNKNALNSRNMIAVQNILGCRLDITFAKTIDNSIVDDAQAAIVKAEGEKVAQAEREKARLNWLTSHNADERAARTGKVTSDHPAIYPALMSYGNYEPYVCNAVEYEITKNRTTCSGACPYFRPDLDVNDGHKAWRSRWFGLKLDNTPVCDAVPTDALARAVHRQKDSKDRARRERLRRESAQPQFSMDDVMAAWQGSLQNMSECEAKYGDCKYVDD